MQKNYFSKKYNMFSFASFLGILFFMTLINCNSIYCYANSNEKNDSSLEKISIINRNVYDKNKKDSKENIEDKKTKSTSNEDTQISVNEIKRKNLEDANIKTLLGQSKDKWVKALSSDGFQKYNLQANFLENIEKSANDLKSRRNAQHYERINSKDISARRKNKENPLMQVKPKKNRSKFITDLNLDYSDFIKMINLIEDMKDPDRIGYSNTDTAKMLPYIALCLNYDIPLHEIRYYIRQFTLYGTPIDVATYRLYNVVENENN